MVYKLDCEPTILQLLSFVLFLAKGKLSLIKYALSYKHQMSQIQS